LAISDRGSQYQPPPFKFKPQSRGGRCGARRERAALAPLCCDPPPLLEARQQSA